MRERKWCSFILLLFFMFIARRPQSACSALCSRRNGYISPKGRTGGTASRGQRRSEPGQRANRTDVTFLNRERVAGAGALFVSPEPCCCGTELRFIVFVL